MKDGIDRVIQIMRRYGRDLSVYDEPFLERCLEKCMERSEAQTMGGYCALLDQDGAEADALAAALRITYSRFFREPGSFAAIERKLADMAERKAAGSEIRIWSAGCAYGQEAYSIAILLDEIMPAAYRIFATDISQKALRAAENGAYRFDSVKDVRADRLEKYFVKTGDLYRVAPLLKKNVSFSVYDLLDRRTAHPAESIFGSFDIVLCMNVLLYYRSDSRLFIVNKLARSLAEDGFLVVGETERGIAAKSGNITAIHMREAMFVKADGRRGTS